MRILNFHHHKFVTGQTVVIIKNFRNGGTHLRVGDVGKVTFISIENLPDFGIFNIRVVHLKFKQHEFGLNQKDAEIYMDTL